MNIVKGTPSPLGQMISAEVEPTRVNANKGPNNPVLLCRACESSDDCKLMMLSFRNYAVLYNSNHQAGVTRLEVRTGTAAIQGHLREL